MEKNELVKYVKNKKGDKLGVLVGFKKEDGKLGIGWSKYASNIEDAQFSKEKGLIIARGRAASHRVNSPEVFFKLPFVIQKELPNFVNRCERYFK